jgi:hypothetical protein
MYKLYHICKFKKENTDHLTSAKIKGGDKSLHLQLSQDTCSNVDYDSSNITHVFGQIALK